MKSPIIILNKGDIILYQTPEAAGADLEWIDVENGEYIAYDSDGCLLEFIQKEKRSVFLNSHYIEFKISSNEYIHKLELRVELISFLIWNPQSGLADEKLFTLSLKQLIENVIEAIGFH